MIAGCAPLVTQFQGVADLAAGGYFSVAAKTDGTVLAWGYNNYGRLGQGFAYDRYYGYDPSLPTLLPASAG